MAEQAIEQDHAAPVNWEETDLYRLFARLFSSPTRECFEFLAQPSMSAYLRGLSRNLGYDGLSSEFSWFPTYDLYESAYIGLFDVGLPGPAVPLFESAHDKSHPAQEIALENTYFYDVLGLKSDPAADVPDYLVSQLEFLSALTFMQENASEENTRISLAKAKTEFLQRHLLNWLPVASTKLSKTDVPGFPLLMTLLIQFIEKEQSGSSGKRF